MRVYTGGTFDLWHAGHVEFLARCARLAIGPDAELIVGLNTDEFVAEFKGRPPIMPYAERAAIVGACVYVTRVVRNAGGADSRPAIDAVRPHLVVIGSDWHDRGYLDQMGFDWPWLHERGIALAYVPRVTPISSSELRKKIAGRPK